MLSCFSALGQLQHYFLGYEYLMGEIDVSCNHSNLADTEVVFRLG